MLIDIVFQPCCIQVRACTPRRHARAPAELSRAETLLRQLPKRRALLEGCAKIKIESKSQIADLAAARGAAASTSQQLAGSQDNCLWKRIKKKLLSADSDLRRSIFFAYPYLSSNLFYTWLRNCKAFLKSTTQSYLHYYYYYTIYTTIVERAKINHLTYPTDLKLESRYINI